MPLRYDSYDSGKGGVTEDTTGRGCMPFEEDNKDRLKELAAELDLICTRGNGASSPKFSEPERSGREDGPSAPWDAPEWLELSNKDRDETVEPLYLISFSRYPAELRDALQSGPLLAPIRAALKTRDPSCKGAKLFCSIDQYEAVCACVKNTTAHDVRPYHVLLTQSYRDALMRTIKRCPSRKGVRVKHEILLGFVPVAESQPQMPQDDKMSQDSGDSKQGSSDDSQKPVSSHAGPGSSQKSTKPGSSKPGSSYAGASYDDPENGNVSPPRLPVNICTDFEHLLETPIALGDTAAMASMFAEEMLRAPPACDLLAPGTSPSGSPSGAAQKPSGKESSNSPKGNGMKGAEGKVGGKGKDGKKGKKQGKDPGFPSAGNDGIFPSAKVDGTGCLNGNAGQLGVEARPHEMAVRVMSLLQSAVADPEKANLADTVVDELESLVRKFRERRPVPEYNVPIPPHMGPTGPEPRSDSNSCLSGTSWDRLWYGQQFTEAFQHLEWDLPEPLQHLEQLEQLSQWERNFNPSSGIH